jgi:hypothetical protein
MLPYEDALSHPSYDQHTLLMDIDHVWQPWGSSLKAFSKSDNEQCSLPFKYWNLPLAFGIRGIQLAAL